MEKTLVNQFQESDLSHVSIGDLATQLIEWNNYREENSPFFAFYQSERGYIGERIFLIKNNEMIPEDYTYNGGFLRFKSSGIRGYFRMASRGESSNLSYGPHPTFIDREGKRNLVSPEFLLCAKGEMTVTNPSVNAGNNRSDVEFFAEFLRAFANDHPIIRDNWQFSEEERRITEAARSKAPNLQVIKNTGSEIQQERMIAAI